MLMLGRLLSPHVGTLVESMLLWRLSEVSASLSAALSDLSLDIVAGWGVALVVSLVHSTFAILIPVLGSMSHSLLREVIPRVIELQESFNVVAARGVLEVLVADDGVPVRVLEECLSRVVLLQLGCLS